MFEVQKLDYMTITDLVYKFVCNEYQSFEFLCGEQIMKVVGFTETRDGCSLIVEFQDGEWAHENEYFYNRVLRKIVKITRNSYLWS